MRDSGARVLIVSAALAATAAGLPGDLLAQLRCYMVDSTIEGFASYEAAIAARPDAPLPDEIYRVVAKKNPSMSFATVYNTLNTLVQTGALRELTIDPDRKRYDPDTSAHHHLICLDCKKVADIPGDIPVEIPRGVAKDYAIMGNHIEFYGVCPTCKKLKRKK